jgi:membrane-associated protein
VLEQVDRVIDALAGLSPWELAGAVVVIMALESSLLTGVVVPGDLVVLFAASTIRTPAQFALLLGAVITGSWVGETIGYGIGYRFGHRLREGRIGRWVTEERWSRAAEYLDRRGPRAIFAGRFLAALHAILPIVAGSVRMSYRRFLIASLTGALAWSTLYLTIGSVAGASYRAAAERLNVAVGVAIGGLVGAAFFLAVVFVRRGLLRFSSLLVDGGIAFAVAGVVSFGIIIAEEVGARSPDGFAFAIGIASAVTLVGHRRQPVLVLGATVAAFFAYYVAGYAAGPVDIPVWVALFSTAHSGRLKLALMVGGAITGIGVTYRIVVESDVIGTEVFSTAALFVTLALFGDALHRRRLAEQRAGDGSSTAKDRIPVP